MILLNGKETAATLREELKAEINTLQQSIGRAPGLSVILVGEDPASQVYVRNKERACEEVGIHGKSIRLPATTSQETIENCIQTLNQDDSVDGILLQLPLPKGLDSQRCLELIDPAKDVDGFHPHNVGKMTLGLSGFKSCTPAGVLEMLVRYNLNPAGKKAVVIGRSNIVGKPLALLLGQSGACGNATVTLCHSHTKDLKKECLEADFLFAAVGIPQFITADMVKPGAVVVDVGINRTEQGLVGDVDFETVSQKVAAITPVPGGVGPMTIAMLLKNTVIAYKKNYQAIAD